MKPYSSARDEFKGTAKVFLDANESPFPNGLNRYPDPLQRSLKAELGAYFGVYGEQILLGNGSDEPIDLLIRAFCEPNRDHILITPPTYGMYEVCANTNSVSVINAPLDLDYQLQTEALIERLNDCVKLVFLCSPNNPTGNLLDEKSILQITDATKGLVIVDEAYADFSGFSMLKHLPSRPNLVVLKTFSKAWGLAAIRLGMLIAHPDVLFWLNRIKAPYNINRMTMDCASQILNQKGTVAQQVQQIVEEKNRLVSFLESSVLVNHVFPSQANFVLVRFKDVQKVFQHLLSEGIVVRNRSNLPECLGCLRISVGLPAENNMLMQALRALERTQSL